MRIGAREVLCSFLPGHDRLFWMEALGVSAFPGGRQCAQDSALFDGVIRPIRAHTQSGAGATMAACSPPKKSYFSNLSSHEPAPKPNGPLFDCRRMLSFPAISSSSAPEPTRTGRPLSCSFRRFATTAASAARSCGPIAAAFLRLGTRIGRRRWSGSGACCSAIRDRLPAAPLTCRPAQVVIIQRLNSVILALPPSICYRKFDPGTRERRPDNRYHAALCRSP